MRLGVQRFRTCPVTAESGRAGTPPASQTFQGAAGASSVTREHLCADRRDCAGPRGRLALRRVAWQASCSRNEGCVPTVTTKHSNSFKLLVQSGRVRGKQTNTGLRASWRVVAAKADAATCSAGDGRAEGGGQRWWAGCVRPWGPPPTVVCTQLPSRRPGHDSSWLAVTLGAQKAGGVQALSQAGDLPPSRSPPTMNWRGAVAGRPGRWPPRAQTARAAPLALLCTGSWGRCNK